MSIVHSTLRCFPVLLLTVLCLTRSQQCAAQVVRGTVMNRSTSAPVGGVLITALRDGADTSQARSTLSGPDGTFALQLAAPGRVVISAKRVGFRQFSTTPLDVSAGESRTVSIVLAPIDVAFALETVVVSAVNSCKVDDANKNQLAFYWDQAQTALTSVEVASRDSLLRARVVHFTRELNPETNAIVSESTSHRDGFIRHAFLSRPVAELSERGFVQREGDSLVFHAPDARVLMSTDFLREHCFSFVQGVNGDAGKVGLAFSPQRKRRVPEIRGTIWIDSRSFSLDRVEFRYVGIDAAAERHGAGGVVRFATNSSGVWHIHSWVVRIPVVGRTESAAGYAAAPVSRSIIAQLREIGGVVQLQSLPK